MSKDRRQDNRQDNRQDDQKDRTVTTSFGILGLHLLWLLAGPMALGMLLYRIGQSGNGWLTGLDLGVLLVVALMLCARWIDQRSGQATRVDGEPSSWADFRRYVAVMPAVAGAAWIAANVIGNHMLSAQGG